MFASHREMSKQCRDRFVLVTMLHQTDPDGLRVLLSMEEAIHREEYGRARCQKAATRLVAGDIRWIDEIRSSNDFEMWSLLGRSIAEAFKTLKGRE